MTDKEKSVDGGVCVCVCVEWAPWPILYFFHLVNKMGIALCFVCCHSTELMGCVRATLRDYFSVAGTA